MALMVIIPPGRKEVTVNGLHQWDYGQKLEIHADDLPALVEVHFACAGMKEAIVRSCAVVDGVAEAAIPDRCLEQETPVTAWIYEVGETSGSTVKTVILVVTPRTRPQPTATVPEDFSDKYTELIAAVNEQVEALREGDVTVNRALQADEATHATSADLASTANFAEEADAARYASTAGAATSAETADEATHAETADEATHATTADTASIAITARTADNATYSETAGNASTADSATNAVAADTAKRAISAASADVTYGALLFSALTYDGAVDSYGITEKGVYYVRSAGSAGNYVDGLIAVKTLSGESYTGPAATYDYASKSLVSQGVGLTSPKIMQVVLLALL